MRYVFVILMLTAIALGVVHLRRTQRRLCNEIRRLDARHTVCKRELWSYQVESGHLLSPGEVAKRLKRMGVVDETTFPNRLVPSDAPEGGE
ncbi:MAG: hypothetical protein HN909_04320 [Phycisphaerales bacterium]|jgi:hypothetical protein|nr:hypothetical protein [Phycisphaerales bacterium]MBT7170977.1 hypothetical protein [Phycisphaerales bacterium]